MSVTLPTSPSPKGLNLRLVTTRADLRSALGHNIQRASRAGTHWAVDVEMPPMTHASALDWVNLLDETDTVILNLPEVGITIGSPGTPLVNGGSQTGSSLVTDGWTNGYVVPKGKLVAVTVSSLLYLYQTTAAVTANGSGQATLSLRPMLRTSPADNAALSVNPAKIEGFATLPDDCWQVGEDRLVRLKFTIEERR